jgi:hypothetical protein
MHGSDGNHYSSLANRQSLILVPRAWLEKFVYPNELQDF